MKSSCPQTNLAIGYEKVDKWHFLTYDYQPTDLRVIPIQYRADGYQDREMLLRQEALTALIKMLDSAEDQNIIIKCISAFRSADYQEKLYQRALEKEGSDQQSSAKPGHSEHQLGTVVDVSSPEIDYKLFEAFSETKAYQWLDKTAWQFGFYISYTKENHLEKGYIWEPWHWRYWGKENDH